MLVLNLMALNNFGVRVYTCCTNFINGLVIGVREGYNNAIQRRTNNGNNNI